MVNYDCGLLGVIAFEIITNMSHSLGNVAVGHTVGTGVRLTQRVQSNQPEQVAFNGTLLGRNRFIDKYKLRLLAKSKIPVPFISRFALLPLCSISGLLFHENSDRRDKYDGLPLIDFSVTLMEIKLPFIISEAAKLINAIAASKTLPDPNTGTKIEYSYNIDEDLAETLLNEVIYIEDEEIFESDYEDIEFTELEWTASLNLNNKYQKFPYIENEILPQAFKINYPPIPIITDTFNLENNLNEEKHDLAGFYKYPDYVEVDKRTYTIVFTESETPEGILYLKFTIQDGDAIIFNQKVVTGQKYTVSNFNFMFKLFEISTDENNKQYYSKIEGGIRLNE